MVSMFMLVLVLALALALALKVDSVLDGIGCLVCILWYLGDTRLCHSDLCANKMKIRRSLAVCVESCPVEKPRQGIQNIIRAARAVDIFNPLSLLYLFFFKIFTEKWSGFKT